MITHLCSQEMVPSSPGAVSKRLCLPPSIVPRTYHHGTAINGKSSGIDHAHVSSHVHGKLNQHCGEKKSCSLHYPAPQPLLPTKELVWGQQKAQCRQVHLSPKHTPVFQVPAHVGALPSPLYALTGLESASRQP